MRLYVHIIDRENRTVFSNSVRWTWVSAISDRSCIVRLRLRGQASLNTQWDLGSVWLWRRVLGNVVNILLWLGKPRYISVQSWGLAGFRLKSYRYTLYRDRKGLSARTLWWIFGGLAITGNSHNRQYALCKNVTRRTEFTLIVLNSISWYVERAEDAVRQHWCLTAFNQRLIPACCGQTQLIPSSLSRLFVNSNQLIIFLRLRREANMCSCRRLILICYAVYVLPVYPKPLKRPCSGKLLRNLLTVSDLFKRFYNSYRIVKLYF